MINCITGLPRSGSTLLCNILNQNPRFHASETSALPKILMGVRNNWESVVENRSTEKLEVKENVLRSIVSGYYQHIDKPVIFDKNRTWLSEPTLFNRIIGGKYIVCVRDLTDILASFEKLYQKNAHIWDPIDKRNFPDKFTTLAGRCEVWASDKGPIGSCLTSLREFYRRSDVESIWIEFSHLTEYPEGVMKKLYKFLGEEPFDHDFGNVQQTTFENDFEHGILDLHQIRSEVQPVQSDAKEILGELYNTYKGAEFWKH